VLIGGIAALVLVAIVVGAWVALRGDEDAAGAPTSATADPHGAAAAPDELSAPAAKTPREAPTALPAETDAAPVATAVAQALVTGPIDELLDKARVAFRERRYTDPEKDNALLYYRSALAQEPDNGEALEGLARIGSLLDQRLQSAMATQDYDEATATLARLKLIKPGDAALKATEAKLAEARIAAALADDEVDRAAALLRQATQSGAVPPARAARLRDDIERRQTDARAKRLAELVTARIREGRLVDPANDSAKFHVAQLRKISPDSRRAMSAARDLENAYLKRARDAGVARQTAEYERWVAEARYLGASQARIAAVQREVRAATTARPAAPDTDRNASLVQERINAGKLLDPPGDSALFHLSALRATDAAGAATAAGVLSSRLLERSRSSISAGRLDDAERHAAAARQLGLNLPDVEAVESSLAAARAPALPVPVEVTADQLRRTRYVAPEYPRQALDKEVGGEVRVKYTVDTDGRVKDVAVTASSPAGVFDEVALAAVRRWRFRPYEVDGQPVEAISGTIMIFKPGGDSEH
jgi:TonB family protein